MDDFDLTELYKRSAQGIVALVSRSFFLNIFSYVASLVIFTYLRPSDVGVYIAVLSIQRIISFITDFGFGAALIQKKEAITQTDIKTTFTLQVVVTGVLFIFVLLSQQYLASFFSFTPDAVGLLLVLVFTVFLSSFKVIPSILLEREIKFHKLIIPQIVESLVFNVLLIVLVVQGYGLTSYSWAFLLSSLSGIPFYYMIAPWKLQLGMEKASLSHMRYGVQFQAKNILATAKDDFLTVFLAKVLPFQDIGYIGFGQRNAFFAYRYIVDSVTKVTFSTYSRLQEDTVMLKKTIEKSLFYVSALMTPVVVGIILTAPSLIAYFPKWHGKWEPAIISLSFFSANALVSSFSGILVNVLDATGKVKITLRLMILWTILTWLFTWILVQSFGYNGVAAASFLVTLTVFITVKLVKDIVPFSFFGSIYKPFIASFFMAIVVYLGIQLFVDSLITLCIVVACAGVSYIGVMYILAKKEMHQLIKIVRR